MKVTIGGMTTITEMTSKEKEHVKNDLMLDNPAYKQAKKFSRYQYTNVPPYLNYFTSFGDIMLVPRGYTIPYKHEVLSNDLIEVPVEYPEFLLKLRTTQTEAYKQWIKDTTKGVIVLSTGKGKSILGAYMACAMKQKTLVIVQKDDLVHGWKQDIQLCLGLRPKQIGLIKAGERRIGKQITICTIQTLIRLTSDELTDLYTTFGLVIEDEVHHVGSKSYEILKYFQCKYLVGLTATDDRGDGLKKVLNFYFGDVAYRFKEVLDDEDIMNYTVYIRNTNLIYDPIPCYYYKNEIVSGQEAYDLMEAGKRLKRVPLDAQVLNSFMRDPEFNLQVAHDIVKEYSAHKSCIVFIREKEHIRELRDTLIELGVPESQIQLYYGDATEKSSVMKKRAEDREVLVTIATYAKATEGTNVKAWERGFLVTSINDKKNTTQAVGRLRRRKEGKDDVIIYDYRHPYVAGLSKHGVTRDKAYKESKAKITQEFHSSRKPLFSKGWRG